MVEAENAASAKIAVETVEAVDLPCLSSTAPGLIKRGIDGQEGIMEDCLWIKGASNLDHNFLFLWDCVYSSIVLS